MTYPKSTTQPLMTTHDHRHGVVRPVLAAHAIALLCSTTSIAQCVVGSNTALSFDGSNDAVSVSGSTAGALDGLSDFAVECWFNASVAGDAPYRAILSKWYGTSPYWIGLLNGQIHIEFNPPYFAATFPNVDARDATWHHFAIVRQAGVITGFFDGSQVGPNVTYAPAVGVSTSPLTIGRRSDNQAVQFFSGAIDEVRIWNVARTLPQIQSSMNVGLTGNEPGLVGYWRFDEGSGQTAFNSAVATGSALDGTLGANALPGTDDPTWLPSGAPLIYCSGCGLGSSNSAAASLQINGLGAVGVPGPFAITGASGSTLNLLWNGPPNQPLILAAGPPSAGCGVLSGFGTIDIGTPPAYLDVVFAFNGLIPPTSYFFVTNPAGLSAQTFLLPVLPGASLAVQGLVFQPPGVAAFGVLPTASFSIQF